MPKQFAVRSTFSIRRESDGAKVYITPDNASLLGEIPDAYLQRLVDRGLVTVQDVDDEAAVYAGGGTVQPPLDEIVAPIPVPGDADAVAQEPVSKSRARTRRGASTTSD
jgi:hypothetical protein